MGEIENVSKQIDFNNLTYYFNGEGDWKGLINVKRPLAVYKNVNNGYITLEKAEKNEIKKGGINRKNKKKDIKILKNFRDYKKKLSSYFKDYSKFAPMANYRLIYGKRLKILTPKQILERFPIVVAQVKIGNTSENLLNEIRQFIYSLYRGKHITKKVYNNVINSVKL